MAHLEKIRGIIDGESTIGSIYKNTSYGVYGKVIDTSRLNLYTSNELEVANRNEIKTGKAQIMCELEMGK